MPGSPPPEPAGIPADPARLAAGWERRFLVEGPRVAEWVALYEQIGFEVVADPLPGPDEAGEAEGCAACPVAGVLRFHVIYTRQRGAAPAG